MRRLASSPTRRKRYDTGDCGAPAHAGDLTCQTDARGVQRAFWLDGLNRVTQIAYSDGTPTADYVYSNSPSNAWAGNSLTNVADRLMAEYTGSQSSPQTQEVFAYLWKGQLVVVVDSKSFGDSWLAWGRRGTRRDCCKRWV